MVERPKILMAGRPDARGRKTKFTAASRLIMLPNGHWYIVVLMQYTCSYETCLLILFFKEKIYKTNYMSKNVTSKIILCKSCNGDGKSELYKKGYSWEKEICGSCNGSGRQIEKTTIELSPYKCEGEKIKSASGHGAQHVS